MASIKTIQFFTVSGPNETQLLDGAISYGGWSFLQKCADFLNEVVPTGYQIELHVAHHVEFGAIPVLEKLPHVVIIPHILKDKLLSIEHLGHAQHGALLNYVIGDVKNHTKIYGVIDPDCYLINKDLFQAAISLIENGQVTLGVPYPCDVPKTYYSDFPAAYFQLFNGEIVDPIQLNFLPGIPSSSATGVAKIFPRRIISWVNKKKYSKNLVLKFLYFSIYNLSHQQVGVAQDTGWLNRELLRVNGLDRVTVFQSLWNSKSLKVIGFNQSSYLASNMDVNESSIDPTSHFWFHGIFENRQIGKQPIHVRLLHSILRNTSIDKTFHSAKTIQDMRFIDEEHLLAILQELPLARTQVFTWRRHIFCIHLGHGGKRSAHECFEALDKIKTLANDRVHKRAI